MSIRFLKSLVPRVTLTMLNRTSLLIGLPARTSRFKVDQSKLACIDLVSQHQRWHSVCSSHTWLRNSTNMQSQLREEAIASLPYYKAGLLRIQRKRFLCNSAYDQSYDMKTRLEKERHWVDQLREGGAAVPYNISDDNLEYLNALSKGRRKKYLRHLYQREQKRILRQKKKDGDKMIRELATEAYTHGGKFEGKPANTFLLKLQRHHVLALDCWRLAAGMKFGPEVAFDFTFENLMTWREIRHLLKQLNFAYNANKHAKEPFHIHWVNFNYGGVCEREVKHLFKDRYNDLMIDITSRGLLDIFPREKLVYLSPDSNNTFTCFNPDKVYVIGALVDTGPAEVGASLSQAKKMGVEHCKLPLDQYLNWTGSGKYLTLDAVMNILIKMHEHGDIAEALREHVPVRKHSGLKQVVNNVKLKV